jgi:hypothetical protein
MEMHVTSLHVGVERQQEQERRDSRKNGTSKEELDRRGGVDATCRLWGINQPLFLKPHPHTALAYIIITALTSYPGVNVNCQTAQTLHIEYQLNKLWPIDSNTEP